MRRYIGLILGMIITATMIIWPPLFSPLIGLVAPANGPVLYDRSSMMALTLSHIGMVAFAVLPATLLAVAVAALVNRPAGAPFLPIARSLVNLGQTIPPVAVLALCVPLMGFGTWPTITALFLYSLLPIFENALAGLRGVPTATRLSARAMGMSEWQIFWRLDLPLAAPLIIAGIRIAAVIAISTATIGSTVAASSLGEVIIAGLNLNNQAFILQGALLTAALALIIHGSLGVLAACFQFRGMRSD
ncbi:ABC transporter permease [Ketogulonicigenium vulgare]|uniref:ABC transporter permease n=1 Tax=Ketogulonicigenium vulgare TaxID=92945 RepID=UPI002358D77C|nr:ABC transporter permease [Ketogulonicigenium vulgare]